MYTMLGLFCERYYIKWDKMKSFQTVLETSLDLFVGSPGLIENNGMISIG